MSADERECECGDYRHQHALGRGRCLVCADLPAPWDGCERYRPAKAVSGAEGLHDAIAAAEAEWDEGLEVVRNNETPFDVAERHVRGWLSDGLVEVLYDALGDDTGLTHPVRREQLVAALEVAASRTPVTPTLTVGDIQGTME